MNFKMVQVKGASINYSRTCWGTSKGCTLFEFWDLLHCPKSERIEGVV